MIRRAPAEFYIRGLLCHPDGYNNQAVKDMLVAQGIYCPDPDQLDALREKYKPPKYFNPYNQRHAPSMQYLRENRIHSLFLRDRATDVALTILGNPRVKVLAEAGIIARAPVDQLVKVLGHYYQFSCSEVGVTKYAHFFMNVELLDRCELQQSLGINTQGWALSKSKHVTAVHVKVERRASYRDPRMLAAMLPTDKYTWAKILMMLGFTMNFTKLTGEIAEVMLPNLLMEAHTQLQLGGPDAPHSVSMYIGAAKDLKDMIDGMATPGKLALDECLSGLQVKTDRRDLPNIKQLSQGNHTTDLQPVGRTEDTVPVSDQEDEDPDVDKIP